MIVRKNLKWSIIMRLAWPLLTFWLLVSFVCYLMYFRLGYTFIALPFAPVAVMGTALSIFLGFRNSSSYDRWWEARMLWGGIVNSSRTFARQVITLSAPEASSEIRRELLMRHLAWVHTVRFQLRGHTGKPEFAHTLRSFIGKEYEKIESSPNKATQLLLNQGQRISELRRSDVFEDFRHIQLDNTLTELTALQGGCERIKNTPLPRQYNFFNLIFMHLFVFLLPFSLLKSFAEADIPALLIPFCMVTGFIFYVVEGVGRRIEDPFENRVTDVPMTALCRTIEIDLLHMLGEKNLPTKLEPVDGFLF